jgi:hypothetical protein
MMLKMLHNFAWDAAVANVSGVVRSADAAVVNELRLRLSRRR